VVLVPGDRRARSLRRRDHPRRSRLGGGNGPSGIDQRVEDEPRLLAGIDVSLSWDTFAVRILGFVAVPFAAAAIVRRVVGTARLTESDAALGGLTVVILIVFAITVMDGMAARLMAQPATFLIYLAGAVLVNLGLLVVGGLLFLPAGRRIALTVAISSGNRNVGLIFALAGAALGRDFLLYLAVAQVPMYLTPVLARPFVRALMPDATRP
jgi:BASS family bile acid:Na+ symporter